MWCKAWLLHGKLPRRGILLLWCITKRFLTRVAVQGEEEQGFPPSLPPSCARTQRWAVCPCELAECDSHSVKISVAIFYLIVVKITLNSLLSLKINFNPVSCPEHHCVPGLAQISPFPNSPVVIALGYVCAFCCCSRVWLFETLWTAGCQPPLTMGFTRQEY